MIGKKEGDQIKLVKVGDQIFEGKEIESVEVPSMEEPYWEIILADRTIILSTFGVTIEFEPASEAVFERKLKSVQPIIFGSEFKGDSKKIKT